MRSFTKCDLIYFSWNVASFFEEGFVCKAQNYGSPSNFRKKLSIILRVSFPVMSQAMISITSFVHRIKIVYSIELETVPLQNLSVSCWCIRKKRCCLVLRWRNIVSSRYWLWRHCWGCLSFYIKKTTVVFWTLSSSANSTQRTYS